MTAVSGFSASGRNGDTPPHEAANGGTNERCLGEWITLFNDPGIEGETIYALAVYNGDLYAGGTFVESGGETVNHIARWNGESWSALGSGVNGIVRTMLVHDDSLYIGGHFTTVGEIVTNHIARWDGENWHAVGEGFNNVVMALTEHQGGLIAGGLFTHAGATEVNRVARREDAQSAWEPLGEGMNRGVLALASTDLGLVAAGHFTLAGDATAGRVALWSDRQWTRLGGGFHGAVHAMMTKSGLPVLGGAIQAQMEIFGDPEDPNLGQPIDRALFWDVFEWSTFTGELPPTPNHSINALIEHNGSIHAAGKFTDIAPDEFSAPAEANLVARWDGASWQALGDGLGGFYNSSAEAMVSFDGQLIVAGYFGLAGGKPATSIAAWHAPSSAGPGDFNCDGVIDGADLLVLLSEWGSCDDANPCSADLTGDDVVDGADLLMLLANWG